jgi:hypothetical protein
MYGSMFLIGAALALAGGVGVFLPPGFRSGVLLALLAGAGVGIAGLAVNYSFLSDGASMQDQWRAFFISSVVGFAVVVAGLVASWLSSRRFQVRPS